MGTKDPKVDLVKVEEWQVGYTPLTKTQNSKDLYKKQFGCFDLSLTWYYSYKEDKEEPCE